MSVRRGFGHWAVTDEGHTTPWGWLAALGFVLAMGSGAFTGAYHTLGDVLTVVMWTLAGVVTVVISAGIAISIAMIRHTHRTGGLPYWALPGGQELPRPVPPRQVPRSVQALALRQALIDAGWTPPADPRADPLAQADYR